MASSGGRRQGKTGRASRDHAGSGFSGTDYQGNERDSIVAFRSLEHIRMTFPISSSSCSGVAPPGGGCCVVTQYLFLQLCLVNLRTRHASRTADCSYPSEMDLPSIFERDKIVQGAKSPKKYAFKCLLTLFTSKLSSSK